MKFLHDLNEVQRKAVQAVNGPVMIIAGAGSGKTRVLTYKIAYLLSAGVYPSQILALTFTNKAANEMKQRIRQLVGEKANELWMGTFHSMFAKVLRRECEHLHYSPDFSIYDTDDSLNVVKRVMEALNISTQTVQPTSVRTQISLSKNQHISPDDAQENAKTRKDEIIATLYREYEKYLQKNNAMDFDDLLVKPLVLFRKEPKILERYQHRFQFILVDEFQDTNIAQYKVIQLLSAVHRNIAVVGDDAQSIYSFRGADIRNILNFKRDYSDCSIFRLEQNYRSTKTIISVADKLISYNIEQIKKNLWTSNTIGEPVSILECNDEQDEGQQIVRAVQKEIIKRKIDLKDIAVLYRTNAQSRAIEDAFRKNAIPYIIVGGTRFYERKEIKDILAYLRFFVNPRDDESLLRIINYPSRGIGDTSVNHCIRYAVTNNLSLFETLQQAQNIDELTERAKNAIQQFVSFIKKYQKLRNGMSVNEWVRVLIDELGILQLLKEEQTQEALNRWENIQELLSAITEYVNDNPSATLEQYLEEVSLVSDIDLWDGERNAVTLMTLHASKGLEFPVVFIAGLEEGLLPFYSVTINQQELEEERRLLYVGITRAEQKLYLTYTKLRYRYGDVTYPQPSRFIAELGEEGIEFIRNNYPIRKNGIQPKGSTSKKVNPTREIFFEDTMPAYEDESQLHFVLKKGVMVWHDSFGKGKVIEVNGKGEMQKAIVYFEGVGTKQLIVKYANLRPL